MSETPHAAPTVHTCRDCTPNPEDHAQWETYTNERFGFSLRYPANVFSLAQSATEHDGQLFQGLRGQGRLLVGALRNEEGYSLERYQRFITKQSWSKYAISYAPKGQTWFVLSGEGEGQIFYEKVMFSCQGKIINSFALIYPSESRDTFAPLVEGIEKSFRPGTACEGTEGNRDGRTRARVAQSRPRAASVSEPRARPIRAARRSPIVLPGRAAGT